MLKLNLSTEQKKELSLYLKEEISTVLSDRSDLDKNWSKWEKQYEGKSEEGEKTFPWQGACISWDTDILLRKGWTPIYQATTEDEVLSQNPDTGECAWMPITATQKKYYEKMVEFRSKSLDLCVSLDHQMYLELPSGRFFENAEKLLYSGTGWRIPLTSNYWQGYHYSEIFGFNAEDLCEFIGWYISEGWTVNSGTLCIAQNPGIKADNLNNLLNRLGVKYSLSGVKFCISAKSLPIGLRNLLLILGSAKSKFIPSLFKDCSMPLLIALWKGLMYGDGHVSIRDGRLDTYSYCTVSYKLAGDIQEISQKLGYRATIHCCHARLGGNINGRQIKGGHYYNISINRKKKAKVYNLEKTIFDYNDEAFCVTTPWHTIYVRRNNICSWVGNCNVVVPVTGSIIDALLARVMDVWKTEPFFSVRSLNETVDQATKQIGQLLEWANRHELKLFQTMIPTILSTLKFGNGFGKLTWTLASDFTAQPGGKYRHIPIQNILFPSNCLNIHTAQWVGDQNTYTFSDLKKLERQGLLYDINSLKDKEPESTPNSQLDDEQEKLTTMSSKPGDMWTLYDIWMGWDVNGDDMDEEIHVAVSYPDCKIHGAWMNEYGHRPYRHFKLFPRENSVWAMGLCEYLGDLQEELTTLHRQRTDNATLANTRFFKAKSGATGIKPGMKIWPGRVLVMDDPEKDLIGEQLGEIYQSSVQAEMILMSLIEKRAGLSDVAMGKAPRRETATTTLALIQEGNKRLEFLINYIKIELAELGMDYLELHRQFASPEKVINCLGQEGQIVTQVLAGGIRGRIVLDITAGSEGSSKEVERQQLIQLFGLFKDFYMSMIELAMMVANPEVPPMAQAFALKVSAAATKFMEQIGDNFNVRDIKELIPSLLNTFGPMNGGINNGGNGGGMESPGGQPGMAGMQGGMEGAASGNGKASMESEFMGGVY